MNSSWNIVNLGHRFGTVDSMAKEAIETAQLLNTKVSFEFNGVKCNVTKDSCWEDVSIKALDAVKNKNISVFGAGWV